MLEASGTLTRVRPGQPWPARWTRERLGASQWRPVRSDASRRSFLSLREEARGRNRKIRKNDCCEARRCRHDGPTARKRRQGAQVTAEIEFLGGGARFV